MNRSIHHSPVEYRRVIYPQDFHAEACRAVDYAAATHVKVVIETVAGTFYVTESSVLKELLLRFRIAWDAMRSERVE